MTIMLNQGSLLNETQFIVLFVHYIISVCRRGLPWELLFADDLHITTETGGELQKRCLDGQIHERKVT